LIDLFLASSLSQVCWQMLKKTKKEKAEKSEKAAQHKII